MTTLPLIASYGNYASDNYGVNTLKVYIGTLTLYYSYKTIVAYHDYEDGLTVCENIWSVTTGKHLNWINRDKSTRVDSDKFDEMLKLSLERHIS